jgi:hypothetical protein
MAKLRKNYEEIYQSLSRVELQKGMRSLDQLDLGDLFDYDTDLWLGFYTEEGIEIALERYGVLDDIRKRGFKKLELEVRMDDPDEHMLRIWSALPKCGEPLLELVVSRNAMHFESELGDQIGQPYTPVLTVQWLLMQNPTETFAADRLPLPGQNYPGLGVGEQVMEILRNACRRLNLGGLVTIPAHFHNAAMYGVTFHYINPDAEATLRALERDLLRRLDGSLAKASWAVEWKMLVDRNSEHAEPFEWFHEAMLFPISEPLTDYFKGGAYRTEVKQRRKALQFELFEDALRRNMATRGMEPFDRARVDAWLEELFQ